ncbi:MAG TPA: ABC transporter ATP-binding protein [Magnetospirillaceae bacterium]|jgi:ABC-2 type transport system ATP-binding protein
MTSGDLAIDARGLVKKYGAAIAVDGIDLLIKKGEIFGLLGPNGAGKTTVILMLLGLTDRTGGTVDIAGHDPARQPLEVKRHVGYMPDSVGFYDNLTARANLAYIAELAGIPRAEAKSRIADALERMRLGDVAEKKVSTFSRGMRQRLGLAEIWMKRSQVAILDEPTSGLDPQSTAELLAMIRELKAEGMSILLSSHLLDRVQVICDRVALFNKGKVVLQGTVPELAKAVLGGGIVIEIEAVGDGVAAALSRVSGVTKVEPQAGNLATNKYKVFASRDVSADLAAAVMNAQGRLIRLAVEEPSLDAIYTRYFEEQSRAA